MYHQGQPGLTDDPVTAYVDSLRATSIVPGTATTRRAPTMQRHDATRESNVCWLLHQAAPNQSMHHAIVVPMPSGGPDSTS
jgi:hypothetical protein